MNRSRRERNRQRRFSPSTPRSKIWRDSSPARRRWWRVDSSAGSMSPKPQNSSASPRRQYYATGALPRRGWQSNSSAQAEGGMADPERWARVQSLFHEFADLDEPVRAARLATLGE